MLPMLRNIPPFSKLSRSLEKATEKVSTIMMRYRKHHSVFINIICLHYSALWHAGSFH